MVSQLAHHLGKTWPYLSALWWPLLQSVLASPMPVLLQPGVLYEWREYSYYTIAIARNVFYTRLCY